MENRNLNKASVILMLFTLISKVIGFVREIVISYMYGTSAMSDAYSMANSIVVLIVTGLAMGIMTAYIPECMSLPDQKSRDNFTSNVFFSLTVISVLIAILCLVFTNQLVSIIGGGFSEETKNYTEILLRFAILSSICIFIIYITIGYLNTKDNFNFNGIQLIITNFVIIFAILLSKNSPMKLGAGYLIAYIIPTIIGIIYLKKYKFKAIRFINFKDANLAKLYMVSFIAFFGTNVAKLNVMIDRMFASGLQKGSVAAINYAFTLTSIVPEVFTLTLATIMYPKLSDLYTKGEHELFGKHVLRLLSMSIIILIPVTIIFMAEGDWIIQILFERGAFGKEATQLTFEVLQGYALGMLPMGISFILCKVYFARKEELIPTLCLGLGIVANFIFNLLLNKGNFELAISTTLAITIATIIMYIIYTRKNKEFEGKLLIINFVKSTAAGIAMAAIILIGRKNALLILEENIINKLILMFVLSFISLLLYVFILYFMKVEEIMTAMDIIKKKFLK